MNIDLAAYCAERGLRVSRETWKALPNLFYFATSDGDFRSPDLRTLSVEDLRANDWYVLRVQQ